MEMIINFIKDNLMHILSFFSGGAAGLGVFVFGYIIKVLMDINKLKKYPEKFVNDFFYSKALFVNMHIVQKITNEKIRLKFINLLDGLGDIADDAWDYGLRGIKKPSV